MHKQCFPSNVLFECSQPLQPRAHYSVFPYGTITSRKFVGVAVCLVFPILVIVHQHLMYRSFRINTKVFQQSHTTRGTGTGTCEAPEPCYAGTRDLCYLRRSYLIIIIIAVSW